MTRRHAMILVACVAAPFGCSFWQILVQVPDNSPSSERATLFGPASLEAAEPVRQEGRIDVRLYGAVGDGTADATTGILAAIASANAAGGGTVFFPQGTYNVDSTTLAAAHSHSIAITANNVTIAGDGPGSCITITGTSECGLFLARNVNNFHVRDLRIVGNGKGQPSSVLGSVVWYDNNGATADHSGLWVDRCTIEDCNSGEWIDVHCYAGSYGIRDIRVRDCRFLSRPGNIPLTGAAGVAASNVRIVGPAGTPTNYVEDILISGNYSEATYIKNFLSLVQIGVRHATVCNNEVHNAGVDKATNSVGSYAFDYYGGASYIDSYANKILSPWTCGFYAVSGNHLTFTDNVIIGQVDTADGTLCTGAYGLGSCENVTIRGGEVNDCRIGIQVQAVTRDSNILIDRVQVRNCGPSSILIRENATWRHSGGVTVTNCNITGGSLRIQRGAGPTRLGNLTIENNVLQEGQIYLHKDVYDVTIANSQIFATNQKAGIFCNGGQGITISGNRIVGPGASVAASYGIQFNRPVQNPSLISGNEISAFQHGLGAANVFASLRDNVFWDVTDRVAGTRNFDLGLDPPSTIPGTMVSYWDNGQYVENLRMDDPLVAQGWLVTGPTSGLGCTYLTAARGDMQKGACVITDVSNMGIYIPGCAITLAHAAAGPSTLSTVVQSWQVDYSALTGRFQNGEEVEGRTSGALANIDTDDGANQMTLVRVRRQAGTFSSGETIVGQRSGAKAVVRGFALRVANTCENTVKDAVLDVVRPLWTDHGP